MIIPGVSWCPSHIRLYGSGTMDYGYCALTLFWGTFLRSLSPSHSGPNVESVQWVDDWNNEYTGLEATPDHWCDYKGQLYPPGPVQLPGCVSCQCHGETGQMECGMTVCPSVPDCIRWDNSTQHCCPDCLERGCFLDDKPYPLGRRIPTGPCKVCYCPWSGHGQGEPDCIDLTCAAPPCVDSQVPEGKCCPICPRGMFHVLLSHCLLGKNRAAILNWQFSQS